jgi:hypothetical protein
MFVILVGGQRIIASMKALITSSGEWDFIIDPARSTRKFMVRIRPALFSALETS